VKLPEHVFSTFRVKARNMQTWHSKSCTIWKVLWQQYNFSLANLPARISSLLAFLQY
jgi:hypothetical protein